MEHARRQFLTSTASGLIVAGASAFAGSATAHDRAPHRPSTLTLPGNDVFPESITSAPDGTLFVSSIVQGTIYRIPAGSATAESLIPLDSRPGVAGVMYDPTRRVLWACIVDLSGQSVSVLEALHPQTGETIARYENPLPGLLADIAVANGTTLFVTDTITSKILRLTTPAGRATDGALAVWSDDAVLSAPAAPTAGPLGLNGIAYDPVFRTVYVGKYNSGQLFRVRVGTDGSAGKPQEIGLGRAYPKIDGIRLAGPGGVLAAVNYGPLLYINVAPQTAVVRTVATFDQPSSVTIARDGIWVSEGQVVRLQGEDTSPPNLPFKIQRVRL